GDANCLTEVDRVTDVTTTSTSVGPLIPGTYWLQVTAKNENGSTPADNRVEFDVSYVPAPTDIAFAVRYSDFDDHHYSFFYGQASTWNENEFLTWMWNANIA